ncbi:glycosyltransferase [Pelagimonas varians]|uniref:N-glycosyltransferase n=1 Tax=Pelagimonas varians TaxID=696760 RepID=A0A238KJH9_9RHOB|nr:glycosyltransferase [Pelagimonas varians]PYG29529.1 glycosyltransferase involved in cell wall biosynthesis [Pelagimonas varians]SMX42880.1 N-glycosyltransferase [Pelagimonas varians]
MPLFLKCVAPWVRVMVIDESVGQMQLSVILPASNEAALIGDCLAAILTSDWDGSGVQVIVVANGCTDDTAHQARTKTQAFSERGWQLQVIERTQGGKLGALNAGDDAARGAVRVYLDADVIISRGLLWQLANVLESRTARYASGAVNITSKGWISGAYARIWRQVPFMTECVPGCGVYAVNAEGRTRWADFPDIISDDTFVRLCFTPHERIGVSASYDWPIAEGFRNLVKVRRRQDLGVDQIGLEYSDLVGNDDKPQFPFGRKLGLAMRHPLGFLIYSAVAVVSRLTRSRDTGWSRSR